MSLPYSGGQGQMQSNVTSTSSGSGSTMQNIAGGSGFIGGIVQSLTSPFLQKWAQDFARHEAGQAWERGMKSWREQNEWNLPKNQMQRLEDAGLNPHLMYGKGTVGTATGAPQGQKASQPNFQWDMSGLMNGMEVLNKYQDLKIKEQEAKYADLIYRGKGAQGLQAVEMAQAIIDKAYEDAETAEAKKEIAKAQVTIEEMKSNMAGEGFIQGHDQTLGRIVAKMPEGPGKQWLLSIMTGVNQLQKSLGIGFGKIKTTGKPKIGMPKK